MTAEGPGADVGPTGDVVAYVPDLMDRSKVAAAAGDRPLRVARRPEELAGLARAGATIVVVDLGRPGVLDALADVVATGVPMVGFASHVERALLDSARAAGVTEVLARSAFFARLPDLLTF